MLRPLFYSLVLSLLFLGSASAQPPTIGGIGAQLFLDTAEGFTMPRIMRLIPHTPADSNLKATDFIMKVDGVSCKDKSIEDVVALIRGEAGSKVKIVVADTKEGARERKYTLTRTGMPAPPPPDPMTAFATYTEEQVRLLKRKGAEIVKTYTSECGDYFFNFNAEAHTYHVQVMTMEQKPATGDYKQSFLPTARVFNGDDEAHAINLGNASTKDITSSVVSQIEGDISFSKLAVGAISIKIQDDVSKCKSMFIVVYR